MDSLAHAMIAEHVAFRLRVAGRRADDAASAHQEWLDTPAYARREYAAKGDTGPGEIGQWLAGNVDTTRRAVDRYAKAYFCTVECSPSGRVYLLVGQA